LLTAAALTLVVAACSDHPTEPLSEIAAPRANIVSPPAYIIDTGPGGTSSIGSSAMFATGSTHCSPTPACQAHFQFQAGKFTLTHGANVQSLEAWISVGWAGNLDVYIKSDSTTSTGIHIPGHSLNKVTYAVATQVYSWKVFSSFNVSLTPGTYWFTMEPVANSQFDGGMTGTAASPLSDYAFFADGNNRWVPFSQFNQNPAFGYRVYGETVLTPADQIADLRAYVAGAGLPKPIPGKIDGMLQKAVDALGANQTAAACTNLQDVIDFISRQSVRKVPASTSTEIISRTNAVRTDIGC
jgi:hypothetical protein